MPIAPEPDPAPPTANGPLADRSAELDGLTERPLTEHIEVYDALHRDLQVALSEIDGA